MVLYVYNSFLKLKYFLKIFLILNKKISKSLKSISWLVEMAQLLKNKRVDSHLRCQLLADIYIKNKKRSVNVPRNSIIIAH
jgi:hypothetical protein